MFVGTQRLFRAYKARIYNAFRHCAVGHFSPDQFLRLLLPVSSILSKWTTPPLRSFRLTPQRGSPFQPASGVGPTLPKKMVGAATSSPRRHRAVRLPTKCLRSHPTHTLPSRATVTSAQADRPGTGPKAARPTSTLPAATVLPRPGYSIWTAVPEPAMDLALFLLQAAVVIFSLLAAGFWLSAATGRTGSPLPWQQGRVIPPDELAAHQAKYNARAAACASVAAVAQAVLFFIQFYVLHPLIGSAPM